MMVSNPDVAIAWRNRRKATGSHFYTDGTTIWSYGEHFPCATFLPDGRILYNTDSYSNSTSKHQSYISRHTGQEFIYCTTNEIRDYLNNKNRVLILTKYKELDFDQAIEALKNASKQRGLRIFPAKKIKDMIENKLLLERL